MRLLITWSFSPRSAFSPPSSSSFLLSFRSSSSGGVHCSRHALDSADKHRSAVHDDKMMDSAVIWAQRFCNWLHGRTIAALLQGSRTLRHHKIGAEVSGHFGNFGTEFKPNHRWSCVSSELSRVRTAPKCLVAEVSVNLFSSAIILYHPCNAA